MTAIKTLWVGRPRPQEQILDVDIGELLEAQTFIDMLLETNVDIGAATPPPRRKPLLGASGRAYPFEAGGGQSSV